MSTSCRLPQKIGCGLRKASGTEGGARKIPPFRYSQPLLPDFCASLEAFICERGGTEICREVVLLNIPSQKDRVHFPNR